MIRERLDGEAATIYFARQLAPLLADLRLITLTGDLGAGKTTLVRSLLQAMGFEGKVKSPTYTLVEPYEVNGRDVYHFDLYRLADPEELDFLGLDDYFRDDSLCLVEWPSKGKGMLPPADLDVRLIHDGDARWLEVIAQSSAGEAAVSALGSV